MTAASVAPWAEISPACARICLPHCARRPGQPIRQQAYRLGRCAACRQALEPGGEPPELRQPQVAKAARDRHGQHVAGREHERADGTRGGHDRERREGRQAAEEGEAERRPAVARPHRQRLGGQLRQVPVELERLADWPAPRVFFTGAPVDHVAHRELGDLARAACAGCRRPG